MSDFESGTGTKADISLPLALLGRADEIIE
jgi:hypothetical protein